MTRETKGENDMLYERFGEFDSAEEINRAAEGLKKEGDVESLKVLAAENGIDEEDVEGYLEGETDTLTDVYSAAAGKLKVEAEALKPQDLMQDWVDYLASCVAEDRALQITVRRKEKSLAGMMAALLRWSYDHQQDVPKDIVKAAGIGAGRVTFGIPCMRDAKQIIRQYYMEG